MEYQQEIQQDRRLEVEAEKRSLKSTGNCIGIGILLYLFLTAIIMLLVQFIYNINGLYDSNRYMKEFLYLDPISFYLMTSIVTVISMFLSFFIVLKLSKLKLSDVISFQKLESRFMWSWVMIGLGGTICANFIAFLLQSNLESIGINPDLPSSPYANGVVAILMNTVSIAVVPAIMEEYVFRGVILGMLRRFGDGFAIVVSAALFGIVHGNIIQSSFAFVVGIILAYIVVRTNSLLPGIIIHFINNFRSLLVTVVGYNVGDSAQILFEELSSILFVALGVIGVIYLLKKDKNMFLVPESYSMLSVLKRFNYVTVNLGMLVSLVICLLMMVF